MLLQMFDSCHPTEHLAIMIWLRQAVSEQRPACEDYTVKDLLSKTEMRAFLLNMLMK